MGSWMVVGWGWGSGGLPFSNPLYYYQVDILTTTFGERLMNTSKRIGAYWWVGDWVVGVNPSLTLSTIIR